MTWAICLIVVGHGVQCTQASEAPVEFDSLQTSGKSHHQVVFESRRNGDFASTVFTVNPDGTDETRLSRHKTGRPAILDARVSWDGSLIAFTRGGSDHRTGVWVMNADGSGEREILAKVAIRFNGGWAKPSLSPDNKEMVYVSNLHGRDDIYRVSIEAKKPIRLTTNGEDNRLPYWSPDGQWIAYASKQGQNRNIMLMRPDGSESRAITTSDSDDTMPAWMPDSKGLLFVSDRDGPTELYLLSLDDGDVRRLSDTVDFHELYPTVSPDGTMIAFEARPFDAEASWMRSIYVMPFEGGPAEKLTSSRYLDTSPTWISISK
ncbi:MAG: hypothetical protein O7G85_15245 [Planctomycetota bacterium]|nr:hypothetical protein [Planctomycetota bacterium]